ncbi:MAG: hypothetical protein PUE78_07530 [Clostridia bacterium]|nr:hypothetical protein [Clostridia bacterium]
MSKKMSKWMLGTCGILLAGAMAVNVYALEEKDVVGTWYLNGISMGEASFHPEAMEMNGILDLKDGGNAVMDFGEDNTNSGDWKIENDKLFITQDGESVEAEFSDGTISLDTGDMRMIFGQEKEEYTPYEPGKPVAEPEMKDFEGEWDGTLMDAFGMQLPMVLAEMEFHVSISDGKADAVIVESGQETTLSLAAELNGDTLTLKPSADEEEPPMGLLVDMSIMDFQLLDDGKMCYISNSDASESAEAENTDDSDIQDGTTDSGVRIYFDKLQVTE